MNKDWQITIWWIIGFSIFAGLVLWGPERAYSQTAQQRADAWNRQQYEWAKYVEYQKRIKERNLAIQRYKSRINSYNRNPMVERIPSNPPTYIVLPPSYRKPVTTQRRIGSSNRVGTRRSTSRR